MNDNSLFLDKDDLLNYTIDNRFYTPKENVINITNSTEKEFAIYSKLFFHKFKVLNPF